MTTRPLATGGLLFAAFLLLQTASVARADVPKLPHVEPQTVGLNAQRLTEIDEAVAQGIQKGDMPGCVVLVGRHGKIALLKAYGDRQVEPQKVPMTTDTLFDLASLTKPVATATSVMLLVQDGKLQLDDPVQKHLPEFGQNGKAEITIFELLTHQSGLTPDNAIDDYRDGPQKAWDKILALKPSVEPATKFVYSDVGFLVLGKLVEQVTGKNVHEFSQERIFRPLGMSETGYLPAPRRSQRAAPTEKRDGHWMQGEVHDPRAYRLGGIAGHAGLFSTAEDLAVYAQMMLAGGTCGSVRILDHDTFTLMTTPYSVSSGLRGLGWDMRTGYSSNRGQPFTPRAFGHGGFTGTAMWIDPGLDLFVIFLSNRLHPDGKGSVNPLAGRIGTIAAAAIEDAPKPSVLTGIDVLQHEKFRRLQGRHLGLITNHTGVNRQRMSTVNLLHDAPGVDLVALFSPEHGIEGKLDVPNIDNTKHGESGLPVYSLLGKTQKPTPEMLKGIDTLVFDIQDIGARFYTYISTMGYAMEVAAQQKIRFVVLDRPNPIGGVTVAGPVLDTDKKSFVGFHPIPAQHGMTVGELAEMFKAELHLNLDLEVVRVEGWKRADYFDVTGLPWINPSPNMRNLTEAIVYPGICLLEPTNMSVGRGTATPFEIFGAPWLDSHKLVAELNQAKLPGVRFIPIRFTPDASKFAGQHCGGVTVVLTDRNAFQAVRTGLEIGRALHKLYPDAWNAKAFRGLLGNRQVHEALLAGKTVAEMESLYQPGLDDFLKRRQQFLLYR